MEPTIHIHVHKTLSPDTHFTICVAGKVLLDNVQMDPHLLAKWLSG
jgi:hypothetical protein